MRRSALSLPFSLVFCFALLPLLRLNVARANDSIRIRADGSIEGTDRIQRTGDVYIVTDSIYGSVVIERNDIVIGGESHIIRGSGAGTGISLSGRHNVTIRNMQITEFQDGIHLSSSSNCLLYGNNVTNNEYGIRFYNSANNTICENNITGSGLDSMGRGVWLEFSSLNRIYMNNIENSSTGIWLEDVSGNTISKNRLKSNRYGILLISATDHIVSENSIEGSGIELDTYGIQLVVSSINSVWDNNITSNMYGIKITSGHNSIYRNNIADNGYAIFLWRATGNKFSHNNFMDNTIGQVLVSVSGYANSWDDGYPSGGNYWDDYDGTDANRDGIGDAPYAIGENNTDRYPLVVPYVVPEFQSLLATSLLITATLAAAVHKRRVRMRSGPRFSASDKRSDHKTSE